MIVVDRIEGTRAVLDVDGEAVELPLSALPPGCGEGTVLALVMPEAGAQQAQAILAQGQERIQRMADKHELPDDIDL